MKKLYLLILFVAVAFIGHSQEVVSQKLLETSMSWDGDSLPKYPVTQPKVTVLKITIAPGAKLPVHYHPIINIAVVTKGTLKVVKTTGEEKIITTGDAISEVIGKLHYGINEGTEPVELIVFYAGDDNSSLSIK